ncbi:hypothetical protein SAMN05443575_1602 [Jatrophihabitans endophyticus]|uniref:Uncharacterized protein n=1 Tax=Jatrophihabitans endophyticus TaxID=1206085 RepID=A0A1M5HQL0_9ACTN|nr:hypothetical protein [Jatrophihabitans endophyticus]SHG18215.1 hypothetical protein SAMN05443575_1602 [Jatrophihabitans endophyticus]
MTEHRNADDPTQADATQADVDHTEQDMLAAASRDAPPLTEQEFMAAIHDAPLLTVEDLLPAALARPPLTEEEAQTVADLLDKLADLYPDKDFGREARELAVRINNRLGI